MKRSGALLLLLLGAGTLCSTPSWADFSARGRARKPATVKTSPAQKAQKPPRAERPRASDTATPPARPPAGAAASASTAPPEVRSESALMDRYLGIVLAQPGASFPLQRLAELYRQRDGNVDALVGLLRERAEQNPNERYATLLALAGLLQEGSAAEPNPDAARKVLQDAMALRPNDPISLRTLAQIEERAGNKAAARDLLDRALPLIQNAVDSEQVLRQLLTLNLDLGDFDAAKRAHNALVQRARVSFFVRAELGRELAARENWPRAEQEYRELLKSAAGDNRAVAPALRDLAAALSAQGKNDEALTTIERALALAADSSLKSQLLEASADLYRRRNQLPEFITKLRAGGELDAERSTLLARLLEETGRLPEAITTYRRALQSQPSNVELHLRVIRLLELQGQLDEAVRAYQRLVAVAPKNPDFALQLAEALMQRGDRTGALAELGRLESRLGEDEQTAATLVSFYERIGETARAQRLLEQLARTSAAPEHLVELGARYYRDGDSEKAVRTWKRLLTAIPSRVKALQALADVYLEHDMTDAALECLQQALELEPKSVPLQKALAIALERTGTGAPTAIRLQRYEQARKVWEQLMVSAGRSAELETEARGHIVSLWSLMGSLNDRVEPLERNLRSNPPHLPSGKLLAEVYQRLRRHDQAERVLRLLVARDPADVGSWLKLERVLTLQHKQAEAITVLEKVVRLDPKRAREYYQRMAQYAAELYRDRDALNYSARAVALSPEDATAHERLGNMYRRLQAIDSAISEYRVALSHNPRLFTAYFSLAELLLGRSETAEADQLLRRVVRSATDDELITRAARLSLEVHLSTGSVEELERELLPVALANPQKPIYRRLLLELYGALTFPLVQKAASTDPATRAAASAELKRIGQRAVKPLLDALSDEQTTDQRVALELLTHLQNESASPTLFTFATSDADAQLRQRAMIAAGSAPDASLLPKLEALLFDAGQPIVDEADPVSVAAVWALCRMSTAKALEATRKLTRADAPSARALAALSLALHRAPRAEQAIQPLLAPEQGSLVRRAALFALGEIGDGSQVGRLEPLWTVSGPQYDARLFKMALLAGARLGAQGLQHVLADAIFTQDAKQRSAIVGVASVLASGRYAPQRDVFAPPTGRVDVIEMLDALAPAPPSLETRLATLRWFGSSLAEAVSRQASDARQLPALVELLLSDRDQLEFEPLVAADGSEAATSIQKELEPLLAAVVPLALAASKSSDPRIRAARARVLALQPSTEATRALGEALGDADPDVVRAGLMAIANNPEPATVSLAARMLEQSSTWALRRLAVEALASYRAGRDARASQSAWDASTRALTRAASEDEFSLVREAAVRALCRHPEPAVLPLAAKLAREDAEPRVRSAALECTQPR